MRSTLQASRRHLTASLMIGVLAMTLTACGGYQGVDTDTPFAQPEDAGPFRFLSTINFRGGRMLLLLSFEGGLTYGFYQYDPSKPSLSYAYDGMFVVRKSSGAKDTDPAVGLDYNFEQGTTQPATLDLSATNQHDIAVGELTNVTAGPPTNTTETEPIGAMDSPNARLDTDTATLSGTYSVQGRSVNASLKFPATIDNGHLISTAADGCAVDAVLQPRAKGNVYDVKATLGPECAFGSGVFTGHALQAYALGNVFVFLEAPGRGGLMLLLLSQRPVP